MKIEAFEWGTWREGNGYTYYLPEKINHPWKWEQWGRRTRSALNLLEHLFRSPAVQIKDVQKVCDLSAKASSSLVRSFEEAGFLLEVTGQSRYRTYLFGPYLNKFRT